MSDERPMDTQGSSPTPEPGSGRRRSLVRLAIGGLLGAAVLIGVGEVNQALGGG